MAYADWTDETWAKLIAWVRSEAPMPEGADDSTIRAAAWNYMQHGADGGGNKWMLWGTLVAMGVDKINREEREDARL